jgi:hypothetical protein
MVNTRNSQCNGQPNNNSNNNVNLEQMIATQNQLMQAILQALNNMQPNQQAHQQQAPPPPPPHWSCLAEFLQIRPTTISQAKDPMWANDWLKGVEKKLVITQCTDHEKVLFATYQLFGMAANWWETYCNTHADVHSITWNEFKAHSRNRYVPRDTMKLKKKEFTDLRQGSMTINESRYAIEDINTDKKKEDMFLEGLNDDIQFQLLNAAYADFQHMVDKAFVVESKLKEMEKDGKRKMLFPGQYSGSNVRPRFSQPNQFFKPPQMNRTQIPMQMQRPQFHMQRPQY